MNNKLVILGKAIIILLVVGVFVSGVVALAKYDAAQPKTVVTYVCPTGYTYHVPGSNGFLSSAEHMCVSPDGSSAVVATRKRVPVTTEANNE